MSEDACHTIDWCVVILRISVAIKFKPIKNHLSYKGTRWSLLWLPANTPLHIPLIRSFQPMIALHIPERDIQLPPRSRNCAYGYSLLWKNARPSFVSVSYRNQAD